MEKYALASGRNSIYSNTEVLTIVKTTMGATPMAEWNKSPILHTPLKITRKISVTLMMDWTDEVRKYL
jgi:hypothetical protein